MPAKRKKRLPVDPALFAPREITLEVNHWVLPGLETLADLSEPPMSTEKYVNEVLAQALVDRMRMVDGRWEKRPGHR